MHAQSQGSDNNNMTQLKVKVAKSKYKPFLWGILPEKKEEWEGSVI